MNGAIGIGRLHDVLMRIGPRVSEAEVQVRFADLYRAHRAYVWQSARRLGVRPEDTEDVVQEVFVNAYRLLPATTPDLPERPWLLRILVNVVHRYWRTKRQAREDAIDPELALESLAIAGGAPDAADAALLVEQLLARLPEDQRVVVVLAEFEHQTAQQIGETLGISAATAASRLRLARQKLAKYAARIRAFGTWRAP